jgi:hypothetical protein
MEDLSIKSLKDSLDIDNHGKIQKSNFSDLLKVNKMKSNVISIIEENNNAIRDIRVDQIEILQMQIKKLLDILDKEPDGQKE